ncbi:muramoyltetrapeptide carboxypeptidase [Actinoplanes cyaneus]|uniref:Muramoyltetrapeptide carboxypeptidase n=1 Tax=Actinoplanes cyaneus TaxID=52696 RepID=A0A919M6M5_9ACTN|nr:muramoyltetrapeptide carboxypeptidase [Actinoplanes cyaneus]GID67882.1 muramoyltetrapeptide carboxypeptidase [Actinoplanes cyaneus]
MQADVQPPAEWITGLIRSIGLTVAPGRGTLGRVTISRRTLIAVATAGAAAASGSPAQAGGKQVVRPPALRAGDRVRVVAPAGVPDTRVARGIEILQSFGLVVETGAHLYDRYGYLAGTDEDRLADLNAAFRDPGVRGVFAARGGYGTQRIIDGLDLAAVRRDPRVVVGFSDLTVLSGRLWTAARLVSFYGPMMNWNDARTGPAEIESLRRAVMTTDPIVLTSDPAEPSAAVTVPGVATGTLLGGNLTMIQTSVGTADLPALRGAILLFEDTDESPYSYDRMLTHLIRSGALRGIAGVAIGQFTNAPVTSGQWTAVQAVQDRLGSLGVPVLGGLRVGHGNGQLTVPLGTRATIDTAAGTLTVAAGVRAGSAY